MLYAIDSGKYVERLPHEAEFEKWRSKLDDDDYEKIVQELLKIINGNQIITAGWIHGKDWTGTVYEPIFEACGQNVTQAGFFYGLILFDLLMNDEDKVWGFGKFDKDGEPINSTTYFELSNPPAYK
ncbi:MAG: hypothetical protein Q4E36_05465 [Bacillota bacterium]|nr:hypothetical protein [Bacillota bacterium]